MLTTTNAKSLIKENMPVVCSDNGLLSVVDHLEGTNTIKLAKDMYGQHHYIPLTWVDSVDDKVHLDRTSAEAMKAWARTPATIQHGAIPHHVNSVDATVGQPIVARVTARKRELEAALAALPADNIRARVDLELALSSVAELLTGDLAHVPQVVVIELNRWLENNKHLAESAVTPADSTIDPESLESPDFAEEDRPTKPYTHPFQRTT